MTQRQNFQCYTGAVSGLITELCSMLFSFSTLYYILQISYSCHQEPLIDWKDFLSRLISSGRVSTIAEDPTAVTITNNMNFE